jgi:hypothetical protein
MGSGNLDNFLFCFAGNGSDDPPTSPDPFPGRLDDPALPSTGSLRAKG